MDWQCDVLIVDDDPVMCALLVEILTDEGYAVTTTCSGERLASAIQTMHPTLVLLNLGLPDLDGCEPVGLLRGGGRYSGPIIALSTRPDRAESLLDAGATAVLPKPFALNDLLSAVRYYITSPQ